MKIPEQHLGFYKWRSFLGGFASAFRSGKLWLTFCCFSFAELKKCLHAIFSQFGRILDIVCLKTYRLRGQAWVVFADIGSATNALNSMQAFPFFEKPMVREQVQLVVLFIFMLRIDCCQATDTYFSFVFQRITYAKSKSDAVAKVDGTFAEKDVLAERKRKNATARGRIQFL